MPCVLLPNHVTSCSPSEAAGHMVTPTGAAGLDPVPRKHQGLGLGQLAVTGAARGGIPRGEGGQRRPRGHVPPRNWAAWASARDLWDMHGREAVSILRL